jgi:hypothetical protein
MKGNIHPYLIARFMAVQAAFMHPGFRFPNTLRNTESVDNAPASKRNGWQDIFKKDDDDDEGEGGGGTIKGHRGKNSARAAAMKRLTRGGGR